jgi:hypothetical protein
MAKSPYSKRVLEIAAMLDVPKSTVEKIRRIKNERPDLLEQIQAGYVTINKAYMMIWEAKHSIIVPLHDIKECARRLAEAYGEGIIFRSGFDLLFEYLEEELYRVDEQTHKEFEEHELKLIPKPDSRFN